MQEALLRTLGRLHRFEDRGRGALQAYLRAAVENLIRDQVRNVTWRHRIERPGPGPDVPSPSPSPFDLAYEQELQRRYLEALARLAEADRILIVGRLELGYTNAQLALVTGRVTAGAARVALHRALKRLAALMAL